MNVRQLRNDYPTVVAEKALKCAQTNESVALLMSSAKHKRDDHDHHEEQAAAETPTKSTVGMDGSR